jgi:hypothetical protein
MRRVKIILGLAVLVFVSIAGWQIGACEIANIRLRDDIQDLASQSGVRIGLTTAKSDDDFRNAVLGKARQYDIELAPDQVTVRRTGSSVTGTISLGADYAVPIHLPGFSFTLHFTPESGVRSYDYSHPPPLAVLVQSPPTLRLSKGLGLSASL